MFPAEPTPEIVRGLWAHLTKVYGSEVLDKGNSQLMRLFAGALQLFSIENADTFLRRFATTIATTIYVPFEIGVATPEWPLWEQIVIAVHEHMHVYQWRNLGIEFAAKYLTSSAERAAYEAEAYRSACELSWWRWKKLILPADLAAHLKEYGCTTNDIIDATEIIALSERTIERGGIINPPTALALAWLNEHAPELRAS